MPEDFFRRALLPASLVQASVPFAHILFDPARPIGAEAGQGLARAPEQPPGIFFSIWALIFTAMIGFAIHAALRDDHLARRMAVPLTLAALLGTAWMLIEQFLPASPAGFIVLVALAVSAGWAAGRFEAMRGLGGSPAKFLADLASGLLAGWMSVAVAISLPDLIRGPAGLGASDAVWPMLSVVLVTALVAAWLARRLVSASPWFAIAVIWGLVGLAVNNWWATRLHLLSLACLAAAAYVGWDWFRAAPRRRARKS
ncbi:MAG: hypothetical protein GVY06_10740 [Alphaproteobacteria bacterium]|jgi:hypothetical protein|nr:hypothetical protein [Alphaproteobacteria bacterium]